MRFFLFLFFAAFSLQINAQTKIIKGTDLSVLLFEGLKSEHEEPQGGYSEVKLVDNKYTFNDFTGNSIACYMGKVGDFTPAFITICEVKVSKKEEGTTIAGIAYRQMKRDYKENDFSLVKFNATKKEYKIKDRDNGNSIVCKEVLQGENLPASKVMCSFNL
jgi:hypothetical protein